MTGDLSGWGIGRGRWSIARPLRPPQTLTPKDPRLHQEKTGLREVLRRAPGQAGSGLSGPSLAFLGEAVVPHGERQPFTPDCGVVVAIRLHEQLDQLLDEIGGATVVGTELLLHRLVGGLELFLRFVMAAERHQARGMALVKLGALP